MANVLLFFALFAALFARAEIPSPTRISGYIRGMASPKVYLTSMEGGIFRVFDSAMVSRECFDLWLPDSLPAGMYLLIIDRSRNVSLRLLVNKRDDIDFSTRYNAILDSLSFRQSQENTAYYAYLRGLAKLQERASLAKRLQLLSSDQKKFSETLGKEKTRLDKRTRQFTDSLVRAPGHPLASAFIRAQQTPEAPEGQNETAWLKKHFLDNLNFSDSILHQSDLLANGIEQNIRLITHEEASFGQQVEGLATMTDGILLQAAANPNQYLYYRSRLLTRFMYGNFDIIGNYITQFYPANPPVLKKNVGDLRNRLSTLHTVTLGTQAPDILLGQANGNPYTLHKVPNELTILVFWSTTCSHCTNTLPFLKKLYEAQKENRMEVVAISLDTDPKPWQDFVTQNNLGWVNYCDLNGWDSEIARRYQVRGTPTYLILDSKKWVIQKPATFEELAHFLENLHIF
jgi:peroxiredoxin